MDYKQIAAQVLWQECLSAAVGKHIKVSLYPKLSESISDKNLLIQEAIGYHEADEVSAHSKSTFQSFQFFQFSEYWVETCCALESRKKTWESFSTMTLILGFLNLAARLMSYSQS